MFALRERKKWEYWESLKGTTKEKAQEEYIKLARELGAKF
jgi:acyl-CoA-binding protein